MNRSKVFILIAALCLCAALTAFALSDGALTELWESGCDFLFRTDNVTVTGKAAFSLDGERFKTAELNYVQDGYSSYYGLKLLTPKADGSEEETGWIIISDEDGICSVIEAYTPGVYRWATTAPQNTLLRRTVRLDALTELGGLLVGQVESLLPEGTVTATEADGGKTIHIALAEGQTPDAALSALNLAAGYLSSRWFDYGYDRNTGMDDGMAFEQHVTPTEALMGGTVRWELRSADMDFTLDAQGRLTAVRGTVKAASVYWDESVREVEVQFELDAADYGTSHVKPFDPADYGVVKAFEWDEEAVEDAAPEWVEDTRDEKKPVTAADNPNPKTITALASEIDPEHLASVSVYARITGYAADENKLTVAPLVPERYDGAELLSLVPGDAIYTQGQEIVVQTIGEQYGYIVINDGEYQFSEDSIWLYEDADGCYVISDWDDIRWITLAEVSVPVQDGLLFLDGINPSSGEILDMPTVHSAAEFLEMLKTEAEGEGPGFDARNVFVVFNTDGQLALIQRYYVPWQ